MGETPGLNIIVAIVVAFAPVRVWASHDVCFRAIDQAAAHSAVPRDILLALARTETGRGANGDPWPWSVNLEGEGIVFQSETEVVRFAQKARAAGRLSFDVGCFQVNYRWHGDQFASLRDMIDPTQNALYAAEFLARLYDEMGSWPRAAAAYHSRTPRYAKLYQQRFEAQLARGGTVPDPAPEVARAPNPFPLLISSAGTRAPGSLVALQNR